MKERLNKLLALVMTFMMLFSSLPVDTLAEAISYDSTSESGIAPFANAVPSVLSIEEQAFIDANGVVSLPCYKFENGSVDTSTVLGWATFTVPTWTGSRLSGMWDGNLGGFALSAPAWVNITTCIFFRDRIIQVPIMSMITASFTRQ